MKVYICLVLILGLATMTSATKAFLKNKDVWSQGGDRSVDNINAIFDDDFILNKNKQALLNKDWSKEHSVSLSDTYSKSDDRNSQSISISINFDISGGSSDCDSYDEECCDETDSCDEHEKLGSLSGIGDKVTTVVLDKVLNLN